LVYVRWALAGERFSVEGRAVLVVRLGMAASSVEG
jgi:hypothetical protein